jgi:hypothetical protein
MKHPVAAGATAIIAASLIGGISAAPAGAQSRITVQQLKASIQHAVAHEQAQQVILATGPAGTPV